MIDTFTRIVIGMFAILFTFVYTINQYSAIKRFGTYKHGYPLEASELICLTISNTLLLILIWMQVIIEVPLWLFLTFFIPAVFFFVLWIIISRYQYNYLRDKLIDAQNDLIVTLTNMRNIDKEIERRRKARRRKIKR